MVPTYLPTLSYTTTFSLLLLITANNILSIRYSAHTIRIAAVFILQQGDSHVCMCNDGWTKDTATPPRCTVDVDECSQVNAPCHDSVQCINVPGNYFCGPCPTGKTDGISLVCKILIVFCCLLKPPIETNL